MPGASLLELRAVSAVAVHRSFRAAAAELAMSPSALSHAVSALEQRLGVRLFHRTTRSVALTDAGESLLVRVRPALREIDEALDGINRFRDTPTGTLRLNTSAGAARRVFPLVLAFRARHPDMRVELVTDDRLVDIVAEGFDAGVRLSEAVPRDMIAVPCSPPVRFAVVGAPRYFRAHPPPVTPADLLGHDCLRRRLGSGALMRWDLERHGHELVVDVKGSLTLDDDSLLVEAARRGVGLAYLSEWAVEGELASGKLVRVLDDWTPPYPGLSLYYPGHRHVPAGLRAFVEVVREVFPPGRPGRRPASPRA
ncbi:MAG: LysR family transcriptional regulator [Myxococcales bacterium]|nr:MAG: LysR family transcriptional regulator [Myxococcales bacterium]